MKIEYRKGISSKNSDDVTAQRTFEIDPFM